MTTESVSQNEYFLVYSFTGTNIYTQETVFDDSHICFNTDKDINFENPQQIKKLEYCIKHSKNAVKYYTCIELKNVKLVPFLCGKVVETISPREKKIESNQHLCIQDEEKRKNFPRGTVITCF